MSWMTLALDLVLIGLLITGIFYAVRLSRQLAGMRASRGEMERFVMDFSATVLRAESGVKGLKAAARSSGDDLEKLIEKGHDLRDELNFLVESADQIASRLSAVAASATKKAAPAPAPKETKTGVAPPTTAKPAATTALHPALSDPFDDDSLSGGSAAERELRQALKKIG